MSAKHSLAVDSQPNILTHPVTTNGGVTSDYISVKNCAGKLSIACLCTQAASHATVLTVMRATAVAGTGATTLANNVQIWANTDTSSEGLTKQADATSYTLATGTTNQLVIFEIDPATLGDGYDVVNVTASDSSQATNFIAILAVNNNPKYGGGAPVAMLSD